ncbi:recQ-mediated genome instability protein 1-like [Chelonus insularis]|uniref:recQ-mediated genome instability protein 1-like n=1 Tax=Chelonus insularis TaxID=460826 RepID=UPI00158EA6AF|nr:recQ-mediated genome instability protein 1-like [Chelonus insularis]
MVDTWKIIKKELTTQFYSVNDTWLRDCVDYYQSEHSDATNAEILAFVISQWQLSDLREINNENGCLPKNLSQQKLTTLSGTYILQIEKGYDISTSKYKQLEKIRNATNENTQVNETDKNAPWEPKGKRMMNLYLTDGIQDVTAIEYQPIKFLKDLILPGLKIMIKGPVTCRRGVFLLHEKNCCEIGGEVENLLIKNATENVLARALDLVENPDPYQDNIATDEDKKHKEEFDDEFMDIDLDELDKIENVDNNKKPTNKNISMTSKDKKRDSMMLNSLPVCFDSIPEKKTEIDEDDELIQMIDETNFTVIDQDRENDQLDDKITEQNDEEIMDDFNFDPDFPIELEMEDFEIASAMKEKCNYSNNTNNDREVMPKKTTPNALSNSNTFSKDKITQALNTVKKASETNVKPTAVFSHNDRKATNAPNSSSGSLNNKLPIAKPTFVQNTPSPAKTPKSVRKPESSKFDSGNNQKITAFITKTDTPDKPSSQPLQKKYDSIKDILKLMPVDKSIIKIIKGTVKSMKKLEKKEQNWYLEGTISDDSGSIDICFSSQVLEKIVGLSVIEFSRRKKLIKTDPGVEQELRTALRKAEATISKLDGLLHLELLPNGSKARIVQIP